MARFDVVADHLPGDPLAAIIVATIEFRRTEGLDFESFKRLARRVGREYAPLALFDLHITGSLHPEAYPPAVLLVWNWVENPTDRLTPEQWQSLKDRADQARKELP